jgi:small subunit ribosomal protein S20
MARNPSALKANRQSIKARTRNRSKKSMIRTFGKKAVAAAQAGNTEETTQAHKMTVSLIDKAAKTKTLHKRTAARKKSRLAKQINKLQVRA